jgi:hypothetical protein
MRAGKRFAASFYYVDGGDFSPNQAAEAIALWHTFDPAKGYYRLESTNSVAVLDFDQDDGFHFDRAMGLESPLKRVRRREAPWEQRLSQIFDLVSLSN